MTTPIGTPCVYYSRSTDGFDGATLPALLAAPGPEEGSDDGATLIVFVTTGAVLVRRSILTKATHDALNAHDTACWAPDLKLPPLSWPGARVVREQMLRQASPAERERLLREDANRHTLARSVASLTTRG